MLLLAVKFILLSVVIIVAGIYLAKFGDAIAQGTGLGGTLVGLVLLAAATSLPELAVDCAAARIPAPDLAVGAIVGSSLFNLFILGLMEFLHGTEHRIVSPASMEHALAAVCSIILTAFVAAFVLIPAPLDWYGVGLGPVLIFVSYCVFLRLIYLDQRGRDVPEESNASETRPNLVRALAGYGAMTAIIFVAAGFLAPTADQIAARSGLGGTFIGTSFVAVVTSLPELVTTLAAVRMGAFDMAVGNVFGSNCFNASILLPVDVVYRQGSLLNDVSDIHAFTSAAVIVVTSVILTAMLYRPQKRFLFIEPDAVLVMILAIVSIFVVYWVSAG